MTKIPRAKRQSSGLEKHATEGQHERALKKNPKQHRKDKVWTQLCSCPALMRLNFRKPATAIIKLLNLLIAGSLFNLSTLSDI